MTTGPPMRSAISLRLLRVLGEAVVGDRDSGPLDDLAGFVFEEPHGAREPTSSRIRHVPAPRRQPPRLRLIVEDAAAERAGDLAGAVLRPRLRGRDRRARRGAARPAGLGRASRAWSRLSRPRDLDVDELHLLRRPVRHRRRPRIGSRCSPRCSPAAALAISLPAAATGFVVAYVVRQGDHGRAVRARPADRRRPRLVRGLLRLVRRCLWRGRRAVAARRSRSTLRCRAAPVGGAAWRWRSACRSSARGCSPRCRSAVAAHPRALRAVHDHRLRRGDRRRPRWASSSAASTRARRSTAACVLRHSPARCGGCTSTASRTTSSVARSGRTSCSSTDTRRCFAALTAVSVGGEPGDRP